MIRSLRSREEGWLFCGERRKRSERNFGCEVCMYGLGERNNIAGLGVLAMRV